MGIFFLSQIRRPPRANPEPTAAASDVYKIQGMVLLLPAEVEPFVQPFCNVPENQKCLHKVSCKAMQYQLGSTLNEYFAQ